MVLFVVLPSLFYAVLRTSFVQTYITQKVASYLSNKLKTEISVGGVDISWFLDVVIEDVKVNDLKKNNLLNVDEIIVDVKKINFSNNLILIDNIELNKASVNICRYLGERKFNYQFIADYFTTTDTTTSENKPWGVEVASFNISESALSYNDYNKKIQEKGIDFNSLKISNLNADVSAIIIKGDTITAQIENLSLKDKSGFQLDKLNTYCTVTSKSLKLDKLLLKTKNSDVSLDLNFEYESLMDFYQFIDKVKFDMYFHKTLLNFSDLAFFIPNLEGMDNVLNINGQVKGKITNLKGKKIEITTGKSTFFKGDFTLTGLPDIEDTYINFNAKQFSTNLNDLNNFSLPGSSHQSLRLPAELSKLGYVQFKGNFSGFYKDFVAFGNFKTSIGSLRTDLSLKSKANNQFFYEGKVALSDFQLGKMIENEESFGKVSLDFQLKGSGLDLETVDVEMNGKISSLEMMNYDYKNISLAGTLVDKTFAGYIDIKEKNIDMNFEGLVDMQKEMPVFDFSSDIKYIKLNKLNITKDTIDREVTASMKCRFKGKSIEDISGIFLFSNMKYKENDKMLVLNNLQINNVSNTTNHYKNIVLNSEVFDANFEGYFTYADLPATFKSFVNNYLPSYQKDTLLLKDTSISTSIRYDIKFKATNDIAQFFIPGFSVSEDFNLYGNFNYEKDFLSLDGSAKQIKLGNTVLDNWNIKGASLDNVFSLGMTSDKLTFTDKYFIENIDINTKSKQDSILFDFNWLNELTANNSGNVAGYISLTKSPLVELKLLKGEIEISDSLWVIDPQNYSVINKSRIEISDLIFKHNNQMIGLNGVISENPDNQLDIIFNSFDISDINPLVENRGFEFKGILSGKVSLFNIYKSFNFLSDITINNLTINNDRLGNLSLNTLWDINKERLIINSQIVYVGAVGEKIPFKANGFYYPNAEKDNFDIIANFDNFSLKMIEHFLSSFSTDLRGLAYGDLTLKGSLKNPLVNGHINLRRANIKIDYLNTTLSFSDDIIIKDNQIIFDSLVLNDTENSNTAVLDGAIYHNNFKDINIDLNFKMRNVLILNTDASQNDMFYGTAYVSGTSRIHGPVENIEMDIFAKTERNTKFYLPLTSPGKVTENPFIKFISKDTLGISKEESLEVDLNGIQLNFDLEVTSDADVQIIFDSKIGDIIKAKGNGNIKMEINTLGDFKMYGDYIIESGDYLFTLQNIINKKFKIEKGSQISWSGDPYDATANVNAIYGLGTPLYDLVFMSDSAAEYKKRMPVNCLLGMKGNLFNPDISFAIDLPGSDEKTKNLVSTIINSDAEVNRQMFALLALNRFLPPPNLNEFSNISIGTGLEATSTELLSNQLSNWLSQISNDFDVGVNYRAGNTMSSDEVEVALSTQLFNDRVSIDGSVATSGNKQNTSQIVGDVNVEVKLTEEGKFRMKFYNKSNAVDMLKINAPYTQGIGLFYRKEFDSFRELFKKKL